MTPEQIRDIRHKLKLTQLAFAERAGVTPITVSRWECGVNTPRSHAHLWALERLQHAAAQVKDEG